VARYLLFRYSSRLSCHNLGEDTTFNNGSTSCQTNSRIVDNLHRLGHQRLQITQ